MDIKTGDMAAVIEAAREGQESQIVTIEHEGVSAPMLLVGTGNGAIAVCRTKGYLDEFRKNPERRRGMATLGDLSSFIAHAKRFMDSDSAIFICDDPAAPSFLSVLNYHEAGNSSGERMVSPPTDDTAGVYRTAARSALPRFGDHRGSYVPAFSDEWRLWTGADGKGLSQAAFGALVEKGAKHIFDVEAGPDGQPPTDGPGAIGEIATWFAKRFGRKFSPAEFFGSSDVMLQLAEGLIANVEETIGETNVRGASKSIVFTSKASTETVTVPTAFLLSLPVFKGGDHWQVPARLSFKPIAKGEGRVLEWKIELWDPDGTVKACLDDMGVTVKTATGLPVFVGAPE